MGREGGSDFLCFFPMENGGFADAGELGTAGGVVAGFGGEQAEHFLFLFFGICHVFSFFSKVRWVKRLGYGNVCQFFTCVCCSFAGEVKFINYCYYDRIDCGCRFCGFGYCRGCSGEKSPEKGG